MIRARYWLLIPALAACQASHTNVEDVLPEHLTGASYAAHVASSTNGLEEETYTAAGWWRGFDDPALEALVDAVLAGNLDLARAAATVREADARARAAAGARYPALNAEVGASRNRNFIGGIGTFMFTNYTAQLSVSWQLDLFGRLRATERARVAEAFATEADRVALAHSLVEQAARRRIEVSLFERRLELARSIVESRSGTFEVVEGRYQRGVRAVSAVDAYLARENLAAARTALPPLERLRENAMLATDVLLGQQPGTGFDLSTLATPLPTPPPPPAGIPAALLDSRPDLVASRLRLEAAAADVDASIAALYPDLTLNASGGWAAEEINQLFDADTLVASILGSLAQPIFAGGQLRADVDAQRARLEGLGYAHAALVLQAVREVNEALIAERRLREELAARTLQRDEALAAEELARDRYGRGLESLLTVLDTERRRANAEDQLLLLQADVWNARIDLHLALGGNWFAEDAGSPTE